jgi:hypothetical protein
MSLGGLLIQPALAATLTALGWTVANNQISATGVSYSYSFTTVTAGTISHITFTPTAVGTNTTPSIVYAYGISAGTATETAGVITYTVTTPANVPATTPITIEFGNLDNPATAGSYTTAIETFTGTSTVLDGPTNTALVAFGATSTGVTVVVGASTAFTISETSFEMNMNPVITAQADQTNTNALTVQSNANSGYTLTVADTAAGLTSAVTGTPTFPVIAASGTYATCPLLTATNNETGYTVTGTGGADFAVPSGFVSGADCTSFSSTALTIASATGPTGATANTVSVKDTVEVDYATPGGIYTDTLTFTVTPNYS